MTLVGDREEIATALSTVDGLNGHPYRPRTMGPGTAYPLLGGLESQPPHDFEATWRVIVILPTGEIAASQFFDSHYQEIAESLEGFGYVTAIQPGRVETEAGDLEAMILTLRKEA